MPDASGLDSLRIVLDPIGQVGIAAAIAAAWGVWHLMAGGLLVIAYTLYDRTTYDKARANNAQNGN